MRYSEFKLLEAVGQPGYYTVGDSHAEGIGAYAGKPWINKSKHSMKSTEPMHMAAIQSIPKGSVVVISLGANDAVMTNDSPATIAARVASIVDASVSNGNQTFFVLFPVGTSKTSKPQRRIAVRNAIEAAISVPVSDLEGQPLQSDGVHAQPNVYATLGKTLAKKVPKPAVAKPDASGQAAMPATEKGEASSVIGVPTGRQGPEVADIQKALIALGYPLPKHGVDGVRGSETSMAVREFQQDAGIKIDGDPGPETVAALNKVIAEKGIKITKSTQADVKARVYSKEKLEPAAYSSVTKGKIGKLLDLISKPESGGYYDIMMGGKRNPKILSMSLNDLLQYQREYKAGGAETAAAGRYQFMPATLKEVARSLGLDFNKDTFNPQTQDDLAIHLLRQKGLDRWLSGKMSDDQFMDRLAQVWAGLPSPSKGGRSWYQGVGSNKAGISIAAVQNTLDDIKTA